MPHLNRPPLAIKVGNNKTQPVVAAACVSPDPGNQLRSESSATKYTGPIAVNASETLKAIAFAPGYANSLELIAAYSVAGSPQVLTELASPVTASSATLNATVSTGAQSQAWFLWGTSKTALEKSTPRANISASTATQSISAALTGLTAGTTYYFQPVATSAGGTSSGAIQSFTTP